MESIHSRSVVARRIRARGGFTLVEMLITLSIIIIISAVAVAGQSTFNQSILLTDTAYTVALSAREAQSLGLSSRKFSGVQNGGYGLHFVNASTKKYIVFADIQAINTQPSWCPIVATTTPEAKAGNCVYDSATETFQTYEFTRGFTISDFCGKDLLGNLKCSAAGDIQSLDVMFLRPNTVSIITGYNGNTALQFVCAQIYVRPPTSTNTQVVRISELGEVSVGQTCP